MRRKAEQLRALASKVKDIVLKDRVQDMTINKVIDEYLYEMNSFRIITAELESLAKYYIDKVEKKEREVQEALNTPPTIKQIRAGDKVILD